MTGAPQGGRASAPAVDLALRDTRPRDRRTAPGRIEYLPTWEWPAGTNDFFEKLLRDAPRPIVNVCCGGNRLGDVRADLVHPGADVRADARQIPFRGVGTVVMDPPWKIPPQDAQHYVEGAWNALRPGGWLLLYAPWQPGRLYRSSKWAVKGCWFRTTGKGLTFPRAPVLLTWLERLDGWRDDADASADASEEVPSLA